MLTGCAGLFIAGAATAVYVVTDPRSSKEITSDQHIALQIDGLGNKAPYQFNVRVNASSFRGHVLLIGQAVSQDYLNAVESEVRKINGVKVVYNQMKVKPLLSIGAVSKDTWITTKVKSALLADQEMREIKITVYTEDTEVFLTGSVSPYHAEKSVDIARNISGVTKVVKAFYYGEAPEAQQAQQTQKSVISQQEEGTIRTIEGSQTGSKEEDVPFIEPVEVSTFNEETI